MERDELLKLFKENYTEDQYAVFERALAFAEAVHKDQRRESGEPYIIHPIAVAKIVIELGMDVDSVIAALLHDTVEDGKDITLDQVRDQFGPDVAVLVDGVTKLTVSGQKTYITKKQEQAENLRKLFLAIANDVRVVIIKLADRLHNMRTLAYCNPYKRMRKAKETLEVYAPLAHRFGMGAIKAELEDLSFKYMMPDEYEDIRLQFEQKRAEREDVLRDAMARISDLMKEYGIKCSINGRPKHLYSIYRKMQRLNCSINELYDLIALRVIVQDLNDCYAALGIIHSKWKPMPGRFKDYIATPKPNQYQSLHTTLLSDNGIPFEVQIRTEEMHRTAEYGIAAHWMYKEGRTRQSELDKGTGWLRGILENKDSTKNTREFVDSVLSDFLGEYVYVLTPQGEILDLPKDSTPIDFAYRIHTNIGNHCQGARVNGNIVKLDYKLHTNDIVEIITSPTQAGPSLDWLKIVKTQTARSRIKQWFKKENREENIQRGLKQLQDSAQKQGLTYADLSKPQYIELVLKRHHMQTAEDMYAAVGYGDLSAAQIIHKLQDLYFKDKEKEELQQRLLQQQEQKEQKVSQEKAAATPVNGVIVHGDPGLAVRFSNCCNPLPGDPIIGYITRGRGVSIHRKDCSNIGNLMKDAGRIIDVEWAISSNSAFRASLQILAENKAGTLLEISALLSNLNISIQELSGRPSGDGKYICDMTFTVESAAKLNDIMKSLKRLKSVMDVYRVNN